MHLVLEHSLADDYLERRAALREHLALARAALREHLALAWAAHERGEVLLAGALPDPFRPGPARVDGPPRSCRSSSRGTPTSRRDW